MVKAAAGATAVRALNGRRGKGLAGVGGGGAATGCEASVVPAGPRGWESRPPMFVECCMYGVRFYRDVAVGVDGKELEGSHLLRLRMNMVSLGALTA
jgi:hypothetical protein